MGIDALNRPERVSNEAIQEQLEKILAWPAFCGSKKLSQLLVFLVEQTLAGRSFNEYSIALDVFQRDESFDPRIDPVVRVHMLRLRAKLNEYQATAGIADPIEIVLPPRTYVPAIRARARQSLTMVPDAVRAQRNIAVRSFRCLSLEAADRYFCDGLVEELIHALTQLKQLRVIPIQGRDDTGVSNLNARELNEQFRVDAVLDGNVRKRGDTLRVAAHLTNAADGTVIRSEMCEHKVDDILADQEKVASVIVQALFPRSDLLPKGWAHTTGKSVENAKCAQDLFVVPAVREHA